MVDNQHKKITGYRDLTQGEIDLMNEGKALAQQCKEYTDKVRNFRVQYTEPDSPAESSGVDQRWLSVGVTDLQKGFMAVIRSIAQPTTF